MIKQISFENGKVKIVLQNDEVCYIKEPLDVVLNDNQQSYRWLEKHYGFLFGILMPVSVE